MLQTLSIYLMEILAQDEKSPSPKWRVASVSMKKMKMTSKKETGWRYMRISLIFYRSKPILDDSLKSTKKIQFESFWLRISFILADKLEEVFEIRSSPGLGRAHWAKVHFASEGLSIPVLGRNEIWKEFFSHFSFTIAWLPTFSPKSFF